METNDQPLTTTVSVSRKLNDGNYGAGEVFVSISGVTADTTPDDIDEMLQQSNMVFNKIKGLIKVKYEKVVTDLPGF